MPLTIQPDRAITRTDEHHYFVGKTRFDGVTDTIAILNHPQLNEWKLTVGRQEANRIRRETADHGTALHAEISMRVSGVPSIEQPDELTSRQVAAFDAWCSKYLEAIVATELLVASRTYRYAGQVDLLGRIKGDPCYTVLDIKSGARVYREMAAQTAAYREAAIECYHLPRNLRRALLHISSEKPDKVTFYEHKDHTGDLQAFMSMLYLCRWLKQ